MNASAPKGGGAVSPGGRLDHVEALRALAALSVVWFHMTNTWAWGPVRASGNLGWLGVEAFFVISGFVIPYGLVRSGYSPRAFGGFVARRMVRLDPGYLCSIVLVIVLAYASTRIPGYRGEAPAFTAGQLAAHLFYLVPLTKYGWINVVYWTLAYEFAFYLAAGLLVTWLQRLHVSATIAAFGAAEALVWLVGGKIDALVPLFLMGVATCRFMTKRDGLGSYLSVVGAVTAWEFAIGAGLQGGVGLCSALAIAFLRLPRTPVISTAGAMSYALYLIHVPIGGRVVNLGRRFAETELERLGISLAAAVVSMLSAYIFYLLIDLPAVKLSRKINYSHAA